MGDRCDIALFIASRLMLFRFVPQQFFPDSTRPELMVDIKLAEGCSLARDPGAGRQSWSSC